MCPPQDLRTLPSHMPCGHLPQLPLKCHLAPGTIAVLPLPAEAISLTCWLQATFSPTQRHPCNKDYPPQEAQTASQHWRPAVGRADASSAGSLTLLKN